MRIFLHKSTGASRGKIVVVFGGGLIGSRIVGGLQRRRAENVFSLKAAWREPEQFRQQCDQAGEHINAISQDYYPELHFIWSAGSGSFSSAPDILRHEQGAFELTLRLLSAVGGSRKGVFHFISSAGGLFEGQVLVGAGTAPRPERPYGAMKLEQETLLETVSAEAGFIARIYRPSTVYGTREFNFRTGLVSHLFWNALRNVPTTLEANFHALRDYVHASDVADYIVGRAVSGSDEDRLVHFLVSSKPSSIYEIAGKVERLLGRRLVLRYSDKVQNDRDITFRPGVLPGDWRPVDLDTGLRSVFRNTSFLYLRDISRQSMQSV